MDQIQIQEKLAEVPAWLQAEYAGIRSGQASPALLDSIRVDSYGTKVPVNQVGSVGVEDAKTLRVSLWDASQISAVEEAIRDADLGVSLATDSSGLRVIFPDLTAERRQQLIKLAKTKLEDARISVRSIRDEVQKTIEHDHKAGELSEDEKFSAKEMLQSEVEKTNNELEKLFQTKETELNA
jgi:ribosome recycling factor